MTYEEALDAIASLQTRGWRLGLDRMEEFLRRAGLDDAIGLGPDSPRFIHVAGTNGKGSVTAYLQSLLVEQSWKVGATFSPYVYDIRERVQIGRELIGKSELARITELLWPIAESLEDSEFDGPTEFEFKTALGFASWKQAGCDWVALEVGLGGRLDATNVVTPACTAIVSIGMDHEAILGDTLEKIAIEKAGIIKGCIPVIVGEMPDEARGAILQRASEVEALVWLVGQEVNYERRSEGVMVEGPGFRYEGLETGIPGARQPHNLAVAIAAAHGAGAIRDSAAVPGGASLARAPGRMERRQFRGQTWILDGAHNRDSAQALLESLSAERPTAMIAGMLVGHDARGLFEPLAGLVDEVHIVPIDFHRGRIPAELGEELMGLFPRIIIHGSVQHAVDSIAGQTGPILVTGSFYLVGEVGKLLAKVS